jgi:hypothetical protein
MKYYKIGEKIMEIIEDIKGDVDVLTLKGRLDAGSTNSSF